MYGLNQRNTNERSSNRRSSSNPRVAVIAGLIAAGLLALSGAARADESAGVSARVSSPADFGVVLDLDGGPSLPVASGGSGLELGYHLGGTAGFELRAGQQGSRLSLTPELMVTYARWGMAGPSSLLADVSQNMWTIQAGGKIAYYLGPVGLWAALHGGYGQVGMEISSLSLSEEGFAVSAGLGATVMFSRYVGVGPYAEFTKTIVKMVERHQVGAGELNFGLKLKVKLPI